MPSCACTYYAPNCAGIISSDHPYLQNWQSLFGIACKGDTTSDTAIPSPSQSPSVYKITRIEGDTIFTIQPKSQSWEASSFAGTILLGKIAVTIRATHPGPGSFPCQVCFNLGAQQFLYLNIYLDVEGTGLIESILLTTCTCRRAIKIT